MPEAAPVEQRKVANLVTSENLAEFNRAKLGLPKAVPEPVQVKTDEKPEEKPTEKPVEAKESPKSDAKPDEDQENAEKHERKRRDSFSESLSRLADARKEAEAKEREARAEAERLKAELDSLKKAQKPDEKPTPDKFKDAVEYAEALSEWKVKETLRKKDEEDRKAKQEAEAARMQREWNAKIRKTTADLDDYQETIKGEGPQVPIQFLQALQPLIFESDVGPRIMYYLNKHPEELDEMAEMSRGRMLRHFARLEEKMEGELQGREAKEPPKPVKKPPEAPEPITPLSGSSVTQSGVIDDKGNVTADYQRYRAERKAGRIR